MAAAFAAILSVDPPERAADTGETGPLAGTARRPFAGTARRGSFIVTGGESSTSASDTLLRWLSGRSPGITGDSNTSAPDSLLRGRSPGSIAGDNSTSTPD